MYEKMTVKEYAETRNKSVQAVYKQINSKQNKELLKGHVEVCKVGSKNTKVLDAAAIEILDQASSKSIQVVLQNSDKEEIQRLKKEKKELVDKIMNLQERLIMNQQKLLELQKETSENQRALETKTNEYALLKTLFNEKVNQVSQLASELSEEKKRKLTIKERILGRRNVSD